MEVMQARPGTAEKTVFCLQMSPGSFPTLVVLGLQNTHHNHPSSIPAVLPLPLLLPPCTPGTQGLSLSFLTPVSPALC